MRAAVHVAFMNFYGTAMLKAIKAYTLELGGKSPVIVCPDVDIDEAVEARLQ